MGAAEDLMETLFSFMAFQPAWSWDDALAQVLVLGFIGGQMKNFDEMTSAQRARCGREIQSIAYSLMRRIEAKTDAKRNEQAFQYCMPRYCDPFDRSAVKARIDESPDA